MSSPSPSVPEDNAKQPPSPSPLPSMPTPPSVVLPKQRHLYYPPIPRMQTNDNVPPSIPISIAIERHAQYNHPSLKPGTSYTIYKIDGQSVYYLPEVTLDSIVQADAEEPNRATVPTSFQDYTTIYNSRNEKLWTLTGRAWDAVTFETLTGMTLVLSGYTFNYADSTYHWRIMPSQNGMTIEYSLQRYGETVYGERIAEFTHEGSQLLVYAEKLDNDLLFGMIAYSALLIHDQVLSMLKSVGGGPQALQVMMQESYLHEDDVSIMSSVFVDPNTDQGGLVREQSTRRSAKSIEIHTGAWRCWRGYDCCWTWFPCCMPGGWCDRLWMNCRGHRPTLAQIRQQRRGWQPHPDEQY
ncbi:uncharacterized protein BYT42DRAFT_609081 [Radiomyces spectabilis]|uniref:uncharacterized protein n=1 Tax=Radiomyces spectabilis TaxID=64574 RepID=UPI002220C6F5|nr:uncharacterized protein BYT42DRAFT_609081 [Radiomyces spectabilis]KAI8393283.1 hypothetical protein BYT42DRAFT_609081 [Radiomyces spectabilis]